MLVKLIIPAGRFIRRSNDFCSNWRACLLEMLQPICQSVRILQGFGQRDGILKGQSGPGANRKMGGMGSIAYQHLMAGDPFIAPEAGKTPPI